MALDLRTQKEKERDALHQKLINEFISVKAQEKTASNNKVMEYVAQKNGYTAVGLRRILLAHNIISKNS